MLLDPGFIAHHAAATAALIAILVLGKFLITGAGYLAAGVDHRTATLAAILLAQMGEFSFVLAGVGLDDDLISRDQYGLILAAALGSILIVPGLLAVAPTIVAITARLPGVTGRELK